jgi:hypothetical protein
LKAAQPFIPKTAEAIQGISWRQRMYTRVVADLYPGQVAGGQPLRRSALDSFSRISLHALAGREAVPFGFWCGGFSSTAGYVSGNEAQSPKTLSD